MGLRIIDEGKQDRKQRSKVLRDRLMDIEARKWSYSRPGDFEKLHRQFIEKIQVMRSEDRGATYLNDIAEGLKTKGEEPSQVHSRTAVDLKTLLDLL